jgi:hypothetical protein
VAMTSLGQAKTKVISVNEREEISSVTEPVIKEKFKLGKDMISINPIRGRYTIKLGQQVYYSASVHGSVGYSASAYSSNSKALPLNRSFIEYDNEQEAGMCGGDSATKYFIFDAVEVGTYEVNVEHYFRGTLESEYTITINVE